MVKKGIVWFDCDGVLTDHYSSWVYLHEVFGSRDNSFFAELYRKGYISYLDWMKIDIALMINSYGKPITRMEVEKALEKISVKPEAFSVVNDLRSDFVIGIISSGVDILVKRVCSVLNSDICLYNELLFIDNILIPGGRDNVPLKDKPRIIKEYSVKHGFNTERIVYVGDSIWDIDVFENVGLSIAIGGKEEVCKYADYCVDDLLELPGIIRSYFNEVVSGD